MDCLKLCTDVFYLMKNNFAYDILKEIELILTENLLFELNRFGELFAHQDIEAV